jgi:hypothetical protein
MSKLFIAITSADANVRMRQSFSLASLTASLVKSNIGYVLRGKESSDLVENRNILGSELLAQPDLTHLLSIDWDMEFTPANVALALQLNLPLVGHVYPMRSGTKGGFAIEELDPQPEPRNGIVPLAGIGMGLCLIHRAVFIKLSELPDMRVSRDVNGTKLYGFFDRIREDHELLREDLSFCRRWRACGGDVVGITNGNVGHVDTHVLRGEWKPAARGAAQADPAVPGS